MAEKRFDRVRWRVGRKVGRTIYAEISDHEDDDVLIGMMDTPTLAREAVGAHNLRLLQGGRQC